MNLITALFLELQGFRFHLDGGELFARVMGFC